MKRTKFSEDHMARVDALVHRQSLLHQTMNAVTSRLDWSARLGITYQGKRKLYQALGYADESELVFSYYWNKYDRDSIAAAVINRPVKATWNGAVMIVEEDGDVKDSKLAKAWKKLNKDLKVKQRLTKVDTLAGIGRYALLLFGFNDVSEPADWEKPAVGKKQLKFIKQIDEPNAVIDTWETDSSNPRFGKPRQYRITITDTTEKGETIKDIRVHHSRVQHVMPPSLTSEVYGTPRLKPIINNLDNLEKILGGDAEMFWRNARPGYTALPKENYAMNPTAITTLETELDKYEHDLRRFIIAEGVDIKALTQIVAEPLSHIDVQIQAISAETGIPKRILIGSERGELSSSQDRDAWLSLINTRMKEEAEPEILRPFVDKCMEHRILPEVESYTVIWEDVFAPSEKDKVEVGSKRAATLKSYSDSVFASEVMPPELFFKFLMGLNEDQLMELEQAREEMEKEEDKAFVEEAVIVEGGIIPPAQTRTRRRTTQPGTSSNGQ
ncbi:hypothetical protein LCGC14_1201170 [marine sediment metagenome]|uniref:Anti-CBASS protein Acb1-like N-terminal domain-containing protein n=1 Tax=marine sediment metagenome TaxID=412755 RepID=A0A0F9PLL8_9ZZZZ